MFDNLYFMPLTSSDFQMIRNEYTVGSFREDDDYLCYMLSVGLCSNQRTNLLKSA